MTAQPGQADEADILWLLRRPEAVRAMGLPAGTVAGLRRFTDGQDPTLFPSRILPPEKQAEVWAPLAADTRHFLDKSLTDAERAAVEQVRWRTLGLNLFRDEAATARLGLTEAQRTRAATRLTALEGALAERLRPVAGSESAAPPAAALAEAATLRQGAQADLMALLTPDQRARLVEGLGPAIDPSGWGGPRFAAPPLPRGGTWLGGEEVELAALKGRVVLLHFFANECINCRRNFPHYKAWQDQFDADRVAIVGVQSPEIEAEKDPARVAARMEASGLTHPVLMDTDMAAWNAWGQTMWPTVYVLDKEGRVVSFWMGELDWQGAGAQHQMADLVRRLLEE